MLKSLSWRWMNNVAIASPKMKKNILVVLLMILLCVLCPRQSSLPGILFFCVPVALGTSLCFPLWLHCSQWGCWIPDSHLMHEGQSFTSHPCGEEHSSAECAKGQRGDIRRNQGKQEYWIQEKSADVIK